MEDVGPEGDAAAIKIQAQYRGATARKQAAKVKHDIARKKVSVYLRKHKVQELFQHLVSLLVYIRPDDPRTFLAEEFRKFARKELTDLVVDSDLDTMFDMVDITRQGFVTGVQLKHCGTNLRVEKLPKVDPQKKYSREEFKAMLGPGLLVDPGNWSQ
eukprot:Hpha_TRINITY_DN15109_c0_g3::TRINITY_DN15109_c0_g3_i2::g.130196::m.130196